MPPTITEDIDGNDAATPAGGTGAPDSAALPAGPRWFDADFEAFQDDSVPVVVQECFGNRGLL